MHKVLWVILLALLPELGNAKQRVEVWSYHLSPPFSLGQGQGLSHEFVELLNQGLREEHSFRFELVEIPRKQVDKHLARNRPGVLLWATPDFFTRAQVKHATWSEPLLLDKQEFVSLPDAPFEYETPESLRGLKVGGVLGFHYKGLEDQVKSGKIERIDAHSDTENIERLLAGQINTLLISRSTLLHYRKQENVGNLYISAQPLYQFARHVLMTDGLDEAVKAYLEEFLEALPKDPNWQILLHQYGLMPMAPLH